MVQSLDRLITPGELKGKLVMAGRLVNGPVKAEGSTERVVVEEQSICVTFGGGDLSLSLTLDFCQNIGKNI